MKVGLPNRRGDDWIDWNTRTRPISDDIVDVGRLKDVPGASVLNANGFVNRSPNGDARGVGKTSSPRAYPRAASSGLLVILFSTTIADESSPPEPSNGASSPSETANPRESKTDGCEPGNPNVHSDSEMCDTVPNNRESGWSRSRDLRRRDDHGEPTVAVFECRADHDRRFGRRAQGSTSVTERVSLAQHGRRPAAEKHVLEDERLSVHDQRVRAFSTLIVAHPKSTEKSRPSVGRDHRRVLENEPRLPSR